MYPDNLPGFYDVTTFVRFAVGRYEQIDAEHTQLLITTNFQPANCSNVNFIFFIPLTEGGNTRRLFKCR
jgi:hypothetical protein